VNTKCSKVELFRNPTLLQIEKLEEAGKLANKLTVEPPCFESEIFPGIRAFRSAFLERLFYSASMKPPTFFPFMVQVLTLSKLGPLFIERSRSRVKDLYPYTLPLCGATTLFIRWPLLTCRSIARCERADLTTEYRVMKPSEKNAAPAIRLAGASHVRFEIPSFNQ
jgi:hypothetical protein